MQRRSQGNENLAEVQLDITAFERSNRRGASRGSTRNSEEPRMETGEGSGEARRGAGSPTNPTSAGGANSNSGGPNAGHGNGEVRGGARHYSNPEIRNIPAWNERDVDDGDNVRIGSYDEPGTRVVRTGIVVPRTPNDFNVKQGLMNGVKDLRFRGRPSENPLDHLEAFDRLCNLYKTGNIPLDTVRMIMFSYSLADDAADWEKQVSSELVSTWEDVKREFLKAFFPKEKSSRFRGEIIAFEQREDETFSLAWNRMRRCVRVCPDNSFSKRFLMRTFYEGCSRENRIHLDIASKGKFLELSEEEEEALISELAKKSGNPRGDVFRIGEKATYTLEKAFKRTLDEFDRFCQKVPSTVEVNCVNQGVVDREYQDHRNDGSNSILRSFLRESFEDRPPKDNHLNRGLNSKHPKFQGSEVGFSKQPYIGRKGLYISKDLLDSSRYINDDSKFDTLDRKIEEMTQSMNDVAREVEKTVNTIQTRIGKHVSMEGRVFDTGKDTRPMEPNMEVNLEALPATLYVETPVSSETLLDTERDYDSEPIKPRKDPGERLRTTQNRNEDEESSCSSAIEAREMNLCFLGAIKLSDYVEGIHSGENVCIGSYLEPERQDKDVEEGIQTNHGTRPHYEKSTPKVHDMKPFNQGIPYITTTGVEPAMEGRIFDIRKDARPMESDEETESKESPEMEMNLDHGLNMEESQTTPERGTPKSKEEVNSSFSRVWKFKGTKFQDADKPNNSGYEAPRNGKPASNGTRNEVEVPSEDSSTSPKMDISYESMPIGPGKDPETRNETTTGASKTKRSNERDTGAMIVKDKSGGKPLISNKQLKPGWNPSRNSIHGKVFEEVEAIKLTDVVGESKFEVSPTRETCSSNGKTRGFQMSNEDGLPSNGKTMENRASMKKVVFSNDLQKYLEKSLRPSQKLKEKINSKCSTVWRVKDWKSNEAWMVKNKSGGKPLHGWDPPAIYSF